MLVGALALVVFLLAILSFWEWRRAKAVTIHALSRLHRRVAQQLSQGEWAAAEVLLKKLEKKGSRDHNTEILRIQLLRQTERWEEALVAIQRASRSDRTSLLVLREKAKVLLATGNCEAAYEAYQRCRPVLRDEEDLLGLAESLFRQGNVDEAYATLEPLLETTQNGPLLALAGDCCFARGDHDHALSLYRRADGTEPHNTETLMRIGHCLRRLCRFKEAEGCFTEILRQESTNITATLSLGACLEARGHYARALLIYQHGKAWDLADGRILRQAGICAVHTERFAHAEEYLRAAVDKGCVAAQVFAFLAYALERQAKWRAAEAIYRRLANDYPNHAAGARGLAWLYGVGLSQRMETDAALEMARRSIELLPDNISWEVLSACEARAGNFAEAHQIQERLLIDENDRSTALRRQKAMRALRKRLPLDEHLVARTLVA